MNGEISQLYFAGAARAGIKPGGLLQLGTGDGREWVRVLSVEGDCIHVEPTDPPAPLTGWQRVRLIARELPDILVYRVFWRRYFALRARMCRWQLRFWLWRHRHDPPDLAGFIEKLRDFMEPSD